MKNYLATPRVFALMLVLVVAGSNYAQDAGPQSPSVADAQEANGTARVDRKDTLDAPKAPAKASAHDSDKWHVDISPYLWMAGLSGNIRVRNELVNVDRANGGGLLSQLDFAFASRFEIRKGKLGILVDENYLNMGMTGTGPLGLTTDVQPTYNMFEAGPAYEIYSSENKDSTDAHPLPAIVSLDVLGGIRHTHLNVVLTRPLFSAEGSRNIVDAFVGNRIQVRPVPRFTIIGKYTVGGGGSKFSWTASGVADYRFGKPFSVWGGYQAYGINNDNNGKVVGFDGTIRGILAGLTIHL